MNNTIQRQYDEVIALHYDRDPKAVTGRALDRAAQQVRRQELLEPATEPLRVLDLGMGTGTFMARLSALAGRKVLPFGVDLSANMIAAARQKLPELIAEVGDAADVGTFFPHESFELVCTHFLTGFVPMADLAPKVWDRLEEGGYWSLVGGTRAGFPALQAKSKSRLLRWLIGGQSVEVDDLVCNPADRDEVVNTLKAHGFAVREVETFTPPLAFRNFAEFMDFAYHGGWLTPFIEHMGLHKAGPVARTLINAFMFPMQDQHSIEIVLAQKVAR